MRISLVVFLLLSAGHSFSQYGSIQGHAKDSLSGEPLPFVNIVIRSMMKGEATDIDGFYKFNNLAAGSYELSVSYLGYNEKKQTVLVEEGKTTVANFLLTPSPAIKAYYDDPIPKRKDPILFVNPRAVPFDSIMIDPVLIEATNANRSVPVNYTELKSKDIAALNTGQDLPFLLRFTPSLITTSDAGNGIGYTGLWIRGSDPSRINVSINGIPLNDPESQQVFWVNTPDLGTSADNIQVQRGVGTSANGVASFGGSIKIDTRETSRRPFAESQNTYGSFNTWKNNISVGSGLIGNHFTIDTRLSRITSDGYIDRAATNLKSFFVEGNYFGGKTTAKLSVFSGREETYQSWYGTPWEALNGTEEEKIAFAGRNGFTDEQTQNLIHSGRTYNFYEYKNQVDNYGQDHYQAHIRHYFGEHVTLNVSGHFTHGEGYFEEYKEDEDYADYGLSYPAQDSLILFSSTDLVRRRWLKNDFFGGVFSLVYKDRSLESVFGGAANEYKGRHFGELVWLENAAGIPYEQEYYGGKSIKHDANVYWKNIYTVKTKLDLYADVQLRRVSYQTEGIDNDLRAYKVDDELIFFNPKAGVNYRMTYGRAYASAAMGAKEPNRNDYVDAANPSLVKPEKMIDFEGGYERRGKSGKWTATANLYYMKYQDQLVLTGALNDVGAPLRVNVPESYRAGIEMEAKGKIGEDLQLYGNFTLSRNKIKSFNETLYDYTVDYEELIIPHTDTDISFSPSAIAAARATYNIHILSSSYIGAPYRYLTDITFQTKYVGKQYLDNTQSEDRIIEAYTTSDLILYHEHHFSGGWQLMLRFTVNNIFNAMYSSNGYTYGYVYETRVNERVYYPQAGRNYMISVGVRI